MARMRARPREVGQVTRRPTTELRLRGFGRGAKELRGDRRRQTDVRSAVRNVCERLCAARAKVGGRGGDQALERGGVLRHPRLLDGGGLFLAQLPPELVPQVAVVHAVHLRACATP